MPRERDYVRPPAVAGMFYPLEKRELEKTLDDLFARARSDIRSRNRGKIFGLISPHAGYPYSGFTAAHGYCVLEGSEVQTVVIISPSHREYFDGISVFPGKAYATPLGEVPVDESLRDSFLVHAGEIAIESRAGHKTEHALEVQIPFLQVVLKNFKLLPLVMGEQKPEYSRALGKVVAQLSHERNIVVVASSDLSHYYPYDLANEIDRICERDLKSMDPDAFTADVDEKKCEACGAGPIASLLYAARTLGLKNIDILHHCNSGDTTGDRTGVVGYLSAVIS